MMLDMADDEFDKIVRGDKRETALNRVLGTVAVLGMVALIVYVMLTTGLDGGEPR